MLIKLYRILIIPAYILSTFFMNFICQLLIVYKANLKMYKIEYFTAIIEKQANFIQINIYPKFPHCLLYF